MPFNILMSAMKTKKSIHPRLHEIECHIFDISYEDPEGAPYEKRYQLLVNAYTQYMKDREADGRNSFPHILRIVPCDIAMNHEHIMENHKLYVKQGYEGIMIKKLSNGAEYNTKIYQESLYKSGKGNHILKYKNFKDEEAIIIRVDEAEGTEKGAAIFLVQDIRGNQFPLRIRGDFERRRYWFQNPHLIIGKEITYRYQELSQYGVPRFPVGITIRDYE